MMNIVSTDRHGGRWGVWIWGLSLFLMLSQVATQSQAQSQKTDAQIMAIKSGFLSERMNLDATEGKAFWPLYYQYEAERRSLREAFRNRFPKDLAQLTEEESKVYVKASLEYSQQRLEIKKKYGSLFLTKISAWQLAQLYDGERDFRRMLIRRLQSESKPKRD